MSKAVSDTQELHARAETPPPVAISHASRLLIDQLVDTLANVPADASTTQVLTQLLRDLHQVLPSCCLAVRIAPSEHDDALLVTIPPLNEQPSLPGPDNMIVFAARAHERFFSVASRDGQAWFHCATDCPDINVDSSHLAQTAQLGANVISTALRYLQAEQALQRSMREVEQLQLALLHRDRLASIGEISAGMIHDVSTPLTCIVAYSDLLLKREHLTDKTDQKQMLLIRDAADLVRNLARHILSYASPDHHAQAVEPGQAIHQALRFCQHLLESANVQARLHIPADMPPVRIVYNRLVQILINLISNACQAMRETGGTLTIELHRSTTADTVEFHIADTGKGILPEQQERIFDLFFTTHPATSGTGLGLGIVKQIVTAHHGTVRMHSEPGNGATFIVTLPIYVNDKK